jgi:hypothetical protein
VVGIRLSGSGWILVPIDQVVVGYARQEDVHCGVRGLHCAVRGTSQQWPPMPCDTECALLVRPNMGKWRPTWRRGSRHAQRAATLAVGPAHGLTSAQELS